MDFILLKEHLYNSSVSPPSHLNPSAMFYWSCMLLVCFLSSTRNQSSFLMGLTLPWASVAGVTDIPGLTKAVPVLKLKTPHSRSPFRPRETKTLSMAYWPALRWRAWSCSPACIARSLSKWDCRDSDQLCSPAFRSCQNTCFVLWLNLFWLWEEVDN